MGTTPCALVLDPAPRHRRIVQVLQSLLLIL